MRHYSERCVVRAVCAGNKATMSVEFLISSAFETVAKTAMKCTHGRLGGVCELAWRRRWAGELEKPAALQGGRGATAAGLEPHSCTRSKKTWQLSSRTPFGPVPVKI